MKRRVALAAGAIALVVATYLFVLPQIADYGDVWQTLRALSWPQIALLAVVTAANLVTFAPQQQAALPGLGFPRAFALTQASTASTYLAPGGAALGTAVMFGMLRGWGFDAGASTLAVTLTAVWNQLFLLGAPAVGLAALTIAGGTHPLLQIVAVTGLCVFVVAAAAFAAALASPATARFVGDLAARLATWARAKVRRGPVAWNGESLARFRRRAVGLLRRRWWFLTLATLVSQLTVFVVLVACLRTLDIASARVTLVEAFAAWTISRLLGSIPFTPGGLGFVELGLTGVLIAFGGGDARVVAAVLLYRFLTIVPTLVLGAVAAVTYRLHRREPVVEA